MLRVLGHVKRTTRSMWLLGRNNLNGPRNGWPGVEGATSMAVHGAGEGSNLPSSTSVRRLKPTFLVKDVSSSVPGLTSLSSERRCDLRNLRRRQHNVSLSRLELGQP